MTSCIYDAMIGLNSSWNQGTVEGASRPQRERQMSIDPSRFLLLPLTTGAEFGAQARLLPSTVRQRRSSYMDRIMILPFALWD